MASNPKIKILFTKLDIIIETITFILLMAQFIITAIYYHRLPAIIPIHFNAAGLPDRMGDKSIIFSLSVISFLIYLFLYFLNKVPHLFNYKIKITPENALQNYTAQIKTLRYLKLGITILFLIIIISTIRISMGNQIGLGKWFLPFILFSATIPIFYSLLKTRKKVN